MHQEEGGIFMKTVSDIFYAPGLKLDLYLPDAPSFPAFLYFHGGGLEKGSKAAAGEFAQLVADRGIALISADYRMYPQAHYPDFIEDAAAAVKWAWDHLPEYGQCRGLYVGGSSAGGYLSMMLCFDPAYLGRHGLRPENIAGFLHDAGQPTCHFNVLRERGIDTRRVIVDEAAPLYHVGRAEKYPPMLFLVSDHDMQNRLEQTMLMLSTLKHFGFGEETAQCRVLHGTHCHYFRRAAPDKDSELGLMIVDFVRGLDEKSAGNQAGNVPPKD